MVRHTRRKGFTLVELLVVIGIIAVLIGILLPSLNKARRAANTVKCAANLRSIVQAVQIYVSSYNGSLPGGASTTGAYLLTGGAAGPYSDANCPSQINAWDWESPIANIMGLKFSPTIDQPDKASRAARAMQLSKYKPFICPEDTTTGAGYPVDPLFPTMKMPSYMMADVFLLHPYSEKTPSQFGTAYLTGLYQSSSYYSPPIGYTPKITKMGSPSDKICVADGSPVSGTFTPDFEWNYQAKYGASYADEGAFDASSYVWNRKMVPGNGGTGTFDARIFSYRHGEARPFSVGDTYRFNAGFYDGHVETLGDLAGSNPKFWLPRGTSIAKTEMWADTYKKFAGNANPYIVP